VGTGNQGFEYEEIERDEREARERVEAAREQAKMVDGEAPHESVLAKLEAEWHEARERLHRAQGSGPADPAA
jgi:hypothetical protein